MGEEYEDNNFLNVYNTIGLLIVIGSKLLKRFGVSINDTLELVLLLVGIAFAVIGIAVYMYKNGI
jgi:hypothetical protein